VFVCCKHGVDKTVPFIIRKIFLVWYQHIVSRI